jgi:serine protease Do
MKRLALASVVCAILAAGCASGPSVKTPAAPALPEVRLKELGDMLDAGSYLQAYEAIDALRRQPEGVASTDLDSLSAKALDSLAAAFNKAVTGKSFDDALRLFDSARAIGKPELTGTWTEKALLGGLVAAQEGRGDTVLALLTRLRVLEAGEPSEADYAAALSTAEELGNHAVIRFLTASMKTRGFQAPQTAESEAEAAPSFQKMISGTVTILVNRGIRVQNGVGYPDQVIGSGFFIDKRGYLLTNHHVIESEVDPKYKGYSRLFLRLSESPAGERIPARVVGYDKIMDLALIKTEVPPPYVFGGFGGEVPLPGDRIYAIGSPVGLEKTLTTGIVSAMGRRLLQVGDSMQVDVLVNPGNSGGPLLSANGDIVGIVFAGLQQYAGLNFAVPYALVEKALPALYRGGQAVHPWLGMAVAETDKGLEVVYRVPGEPAALAGIATGDIIEQVDGTQYKKLSDIQAGVLAHATPSLVTLALRKGDTHFNAVLCLSQRPDDPIEVALKRDTRDNVLYPLFGMQLENVGSFFWRGSYVVKRVTKGSVADESGISVDDPLVIQDWQVDADKGYALLQVVIKKKRAGFIESAVQIATYLETDNFI